MNKLNNKETDLWDLCGQITSPPVPSKDEVWMRLEQHIDILDQKSPNGNTITKPIWIKWQPRFIYAFLLAFLLIMPTTIRYLNTNTVSSEFGMTNRNVILSDGTSIQLNADSKISYGSNYGNGNRNVSLKGEAFFNVTPSNVPFVVSTDYAKITVLGTKFNVRARNDGFETGVNEGLVEINKNDKSLVLSKGQRALIESKNAETIHSSSTNNHYPGWLNNKIICDNTSLDKICKEIERTYNIKILFKDISKKKVSISGIIDLYPNNLKSVISSISLLADLEFKLKGDAYIVL